MNERNAHGSESRSEQTVWRLPPDVTIKAIEDLPEGYLELIAPGGKIPRGHFAIERKKVRAHPKIVNKDVVDVLRAFSGEGKTYNEVLEHFARERRIDRDKLHEGMQKMVKDFIKSNYLVPAGGGAGDASARIEPSFEPGDRWLSYRIVENVHCIIDSEIYRVEDPSSGRTMALKIAQKVFPDQAMRNKANERLRQEFVLIDNLRHPNIIELLEYGEHEGRVYGVLEWIDGPTIRRYAYRSGIPPTDAELLRLSRESLEALAVVHRAGYLHGDVHTGNFLTKDGHVCLIDFGLARPIEIPSGEEDKYTEGGVLQYMPPEYVRYYLEKKKGLWGSVAGEIYSCGVMIFALFTRTYPYKFSFYRDEYMKSISSEPPMKFEECNREAWPELEEVLNKAMAKDPNDRFESTDAFLEALGEVRPRGASIAVSAAPPAREDNEAGRTAGAGAGKWTRRAMEWIARLEASEFGNFKVLHRPPYRSFNSGASGVAYALWKAACLLEEPKWLNYARLWIENTAAMPPDAATYEMPEEKGTVAEIDVDNSFFHGNRGVAFVRMLVAWAQNDEHTLNVALNEWAKPETKVLKVQDALQGRPGRLIGNAILYNETRDEFLLEHGNEIADALLECSRVQDTDVPWGNNHTLGMAHGRGGIYYSLLLWSKTTGYKLPEWVREHTLRFAESGIEQKHGISWPIDERAPDRYMDSWCNGAPGLIHLWATAYVLFGDDVFLETARKAGEYCAAKEDYTLGHLCCGAAGAAYGMLALHKIDPGGPWLEHAARFADTAASAKLISPYPLGLYTGVSGIACLMLDMESPEAACQPGFGI